MVGAELKKERWMPLFLCPGRKPGIYQLPSKKTYVNIYIFEN